MQSSLPYRRDMLETTNKSIPIFKETYSITSFLLPYKHSNNSPPQIRYDIAMANIAKEALTEPQISFEMRAFKIKGWTLLTPLKIVFEYDEDGTVIVSDEVFNEYGEGKTLNEARIDFERSLVEYYELLEANVTDEHLETEASLNYMKQFLQRW